MNWLRRSLFGATAIGVGAITVIPAALASYSAPHKWTDNATQKTYVYIPGQTAGLPVAGLTSPKAPTQRVLTLNNCGWGSFTKSATSPPVNVTGNGLDWSTKTSGSAVTCTKDAAPATTYTSSNNGPVGTIVDDGTKIWIKGGTSAGSLAIEITNSGTITTKANACGFLRVAVSATRPMTTFNIGSTSYSLSSLPSVTNPMICKKVGSSSFTYVPAS